MAKLNASKRNALPDSDFAGPDRSFPVEDAGHAKAALSRAAANAPGLVTKIRAKVHRNFPTMKLRGLNK